MPAKLDVLEERVANMLKQNGDEHKAIMQEVAKINDKLDELFVTKNEFNPVKSDVKDLQENITWIVRVVVGAIVLAVLAFIGLKG